MVGRSKVGANTRGPPDLRRSRKRRRSGPPGPVARCCTSGAMGLAATKIQIGVSDMSVLGRFTALLFFFLFIYFPVQAQLDFRLLQPNTNLYDGFVKGQKEAQEAERRNLEIENIKLQNRQKQLELEQQLQAQRIKSEEASRRQESPKIDANKKGPQKADENPVFDEWLKAAAPRMGLYPDFEKVVFSGEVAITNDMVRLMTNSLLAADIAYYLGMHKYESMAISKMNLSQAASAIAQIETRLKASKLP